MTDIPSTSGRLHCEFVILLFSKDHRETDLFLTSSGVQVSQSNFHLLHTVFSSQIKSKVGHILVKDAVLRINLNIDGTPISSRSHTHPSHNQKSLLLTLSLSIGVPVPHATQCMRDEDVEIQSLKHSSAWLSSLWWSVITLTV
jgi:hypothetical protein